MTSSEPTLFPVEQLPAKLDDDWPADYEAQFWTACPTGRKVEKGATMKALAKVRKAGISWAKLFAAWLSYAAANADTEARFIKHPTTWLNKGCYDDEPTPPPTRGGPSFFEIATGQVDWRNGKRSR